MASDSDESLDRFLLPGESVVQRYHKVKSAGKFNAVLTDRRMLLVGRNAFEEIHLSAIASMASRTNGRQGLIAGGIALVSLGFAAMLVSYEYNAIGLWLMILGAPLSVLGVILRRHVVHVNAGGQGFDFVGNSTSLQEFIRDVRLQQSRFAGFARQVPVSGGLQAGSVQQTVTLSPGAEKEVIREIVKVRCRACGLLADLSLEKCTNCGSPL